MSVNEFASAGLTNGQLNAIVKKLGGHERALMFLRGQLIISDPNSTWREIDGVIYFSVVSDGITGPQWIERLEKKCFRVNEYAKGLLCSREFQPTNEITTEVAILKGMLFSSINRVIKKIRIYAEDRKLLKPNAEIACLIREKFSDKDLKAMGLGSIIVMHEPILDADCDPSLLNSHRNSGGFWLDTDYCRPDREWYHDSSFAFAVSQVKSPRAK